jgi:hypothetical protein
VKGLRILCPGRACSADYPPGTQVRLTAVALKGNVFKGWSGACQGAQSTCVLSPASGSTTEVTATFESA